MIVFLAPLLIFATKKAVEHSLSGAIAEGISEAEFEVEKRVTKTLVSSFLNVALNISLLLLIVYITPLFLDRDRVVYLICSVYLGSLFHALYNGLKSLPQLYRYLVRHQGNLKTYLEHEIFEEAHLKADTQLQRKNFLLRGLNAVFGQSPEQIARKVSDHATRLVLNKVLAYLAVAVAATLTYILVFRLMVAPVLIEDATGLGLIDAAVYPLLVSIDYFFGSDLLFWASSR